jgi:membrane-associated phospholipid phosphatase
MADWFYDLVTGGVDFVLLVQSYRTPFLTVIFRVATFLNEEEFYLLLIPLIYWVIHKPFGRQVTYLIFLSNLINVFAKNIFRLPRPPTPPVIRLVEASGYGMPSNHTMTPTVLWGYIAWRWHSLGRWVTPLAGLIVFLVAFSRIYLGVHFPADVIGGFILGLIVLSLWLKFGSRFTVWLKRVGDRPVLTAAILVPLLVFFLFPGDNIGYPAKDTATLSGILLGANVGFFYEARRVRFAVSGSWQQRLLRYLFGLVFVAVFWFGLRLFFDLIEVGYFVEMVLRFFRYAIAACALTWWAPAAFIRLRLAERESPMARGAID